MVILLYAVKIKMFNYISIDGELNINRIIALLILFAESKVS